MTAHPLKIPAVVVPWYPGTSDPWRLRWLPEVVRHWHRVEWLFTFGEGMEGEARNQGVNSTTGDPLVVVDADGIVDLEAAKEAVVMAEDQDGLVVAYDRAVYLTAAASDNLTVTEVAHILQENDRRWPYETTVDQESRTSVGGVQVFNRRTFDLTGGYDPRIVHGHDAAFALAADALTGHPMRRVEGDFVHLWHPRPQVEDPPETWAALRQYHQAAEAGKDAMRALIESRRGVPA